MRTLHALLLLSAAAVAQNTVVSPAGLANQSGNGANLWPWAQATTRYQQVHSDLGPTPRLYRKLAFRQAAGNGTFTGVRVLDLEVWAGNARSYDTVSTAFASNYVTPRTNVIARKLVNFGPQGPAANPSPFQGMDLVFDAPVAHVLAFSFAWEVVIHANALTGVFASSDCSRPWCG